MSKTLFYINIINENEVITQYATQEEIDQLKADGKEVIVDQQMQLNENDNNDDSNNENNTNENDGNNSQL